MAITALSGSLIFTAEISISPSSFKYSISIFSVSSFSLIKIALPPLLFFAYRTQLSTDNHQV